MFCILAVTVVTLFGSSEPPEIGATATLPGPAVEIDEPIIFAESETTDDIDLPGLDEPENSPEPSTQQDDTRPDVSLANTSLTSAPVPGLYEEGPGGPLPIISASGQRPSQVYARSFEGDPDAPTMAIIVGGLGLNRTLTQDAITQLPAEVTLSFVPYARDLQAWIDQARADGHEVLIELPMEPFDYPNNDPGPHTLLSEASESENRQKLEWLLSRAAGYTGVINYLGNRLGGAEEPLTAIFETLESRGITVFHDGSGRRNVIRNAADSAEANLALVDRVIDANPEPAAIDGRLLELEALALQNGQSLGFAFPYPASVEALSDWAAGLSSRGYQLAPASWVANQMNSDGEPET